MSNTTDRPVVPDEIADMMYDEELDNMRTLDGWAIGSVEHRNQLGCTDDRFEEAWIELFNGAGRALDIGGVRFMAVRGGELTEAYAYATLDASVGNLPCYCVVEYDRPPEQDVDYGKPGPR